MSDERPEYLNENGEHKALARYLDVWDGWRCLVRQIAERTGEDEETIALCIAVVDLRGIRNGMTQMVAAFNQMATQFGTMEETLDRLIQAYNAWTAAYHENSDAIAESRKEHRELMEQQMAMSREALEHMRRLGDDDEPWKD